LECGNWLPLSFVRGWTVAGGEVKSGKLKWVVRLPLLFQTIQRAAESSAPKGRDRKAQGNALGSEDPNMNGKP